MKHEFNLKIKYSDARPAEKSAFTIAFREGKSVFETILTEMKEFFITVSGLNIFERLIVLRSSVVVKHLLAAKINIHASLMKSAVVFKEAIELSFGNLLKVFSNQHISLKLTQALHTILNLRMLMEQSVVPMTELVARLKMRVVKSAPVALVHTLVERTKERIPIANEFTLKHIFNHLTVSALIRLGHWDGYQLGALDSLTLMDMDAENII